jgi:hypothetical protein
MWKNIVEPARQAACILRAGYHKLQTRTQNIQYLLLFNCNSGCTNALQYYVLRTLSVLFKIVDEFQVQ